MNHQGTKKYVHNRDTYFILSELDSIQILSKNEIGTRRLVHNKRIFILSGFIISGPDCIAAKCGYLEGGARPPQVWSLWGAVVPGSGVVEEAVVWQDFTQTYRLQLNPIIMLIESRYISQLHFYSTIVRDFFLR